MKLAQSPKTNAAPLLQTTLGLTSSFCRLDSITRSECVAFFVGNGDDKPEVESLATRVRNEIRVTALSGELALVSGKPRQRRVEYSTLAICLRPSDLT